MIQNNNNLITSYKKKYIFDTSAIIALIKQEPGYQILENVLANAAMSAVNLSELISVLTRSEIAEEEVNEIITDLVPQIIPFTNDIAIRAGKLIKNTKKFGLSLGDRACLATGIHHHMTIYTTDKIWQELKLTLVLPSNCHIVIIR